VFTPTNLHTCFSRSRFNMPSVVPVCFLVSVLVCADAAALTTKEDAAEVVVGADAKQIMRNAKKGDATAKKDTAPTKLVSINLYYETRCPDCIEFINNTLAPMWANKDIRPHLNITVNPYGNAMSIPMANVSAGYKFWHAETTGTGFDYVHVCQHGSDECLGNLIQACAISMVEKEKYMDMVFCMAAKPDWSIEKASYECMVSAGVPHDQVKECATSARGNKLYADLGRKTDAVPGRQGTPWIMIDGINLQNVTDLMRTVCTGIGDAGPTSCSSFQAAPAATEAPAKDDRPSQEGGDGDFTVLAASKKRELAQLSSKHI